jgi:hypothetical protein
MADLEIPGSIEDLCLARADDVNPNRPLFTGDVIDGVVVPILGDEPQPVAIVSHPCSMRAGASLAELLHVAPVTLYQAPNDQVWNKHFKVMPLGPVGGIEHAVARLDKMTLVAGAEIEVDKRVFCATRPGINLMRQRLVHHLTRVVVPTFDFDAEAAGAHEEAELLEDWTDEAVRCGTAVAAACIEFHEWITETDGDRTRQDALVDPQEVPGIRRAMRAELKARYG